jgi:hypothetical protein
MTLIAMTREIGSHGSEVAARVPAASRLEFINSEIVVPHVALGVEQSAVQRYLEGKASVPSHDWAEVLVPDEGRRKSYAEQSGRGARYRILPSQN